MSDFLDRVDRALMNGGIVSDPLVENFISLVSEAIRPKIGVAVLERWMADDPDTSDLPYKLLKRVKDEIVITKFSEHAFTENDPKTIILVSEAIAKLQLVDLSASPSLAGDLIEATYGHASELDDYIRGNEEALDNEKFRQNVVAFFSALSEKSQSKRLRGLAAEILGEIREENPDEPTEPEEDDDEEIRKWLGDEPVDSEEAEELRKWLSDEPKEPKKDDEDLLGLDWEKAEVGRPPEGGRGDEPPEMRPVEPGEFPPKSKQEKIADLMDPDGEPDDPEEALRQKMAAKGLATKTRLKPEENPEEEPQGLDIKVKEKGGEDTPEGKVARDRIQILRTSGDQALVRVKAMKQDKKTGQKFRTYRFATINQADAGELNPANIWKYLKGLYGMAQSDPRYSRQYNEMFSVNLKDAYSSFDAPPSNFREHIKNFVGDSPSDRLMRAYSRNDPHDRYRLSGAISSIDDRTAARILGDLRPKMRIDMDQAANWLRAQKEKYEGKELGEDREITNEVMLGRVLLELNERLDKELGELAANALMFNAIAKEILRNPSMLEEYGVEVPDFAKTREKRFKQWRQQEVGSGRVGWPEKEKDLDWGDIGTFPSGEVPPERKAEYRAMFGKELEPHEKNIQKNLISTFSKIAGNEELLRAYRGWLNKEAKSGNLGGTEAEVAVELIDAAVKGTLREYLNTYTGEYHILDRIGRLVQHRVSRLVRQI